MPSASVPNEILTLYDSLTAANFAGGVRPTPYFGEAPQADISGQVRIPYTVIRDDGRTFSALSNFSGWESGTFTVQMFDFTLANLGTSVLALRFNGSAPSARAGFDFATLALSSPFYHISFAFENEQYDYAGFDLDGKRVHQATLTYRVVVGVSP